jgi:hypothetical protein
LFRDFSFYALNILLSESISRSFVQMSEKSKSDVGPAPHTASHKRLMPVTR